MSEEENKPLYSSENHEPFKIESSRPTIANYLLPPIKTEHQAFFKKSHEEISDRQSCQEVIKFLKDYTEGRHWKFWKYTHKDAVRLTIANLEKLEKQDGLTIPAVKKMFKHFCKK